ncbi:hypothetical protein [Haploplasma axanthum]|uniref:Uncharacterized protein n=1 Tax=Haploplasma axanthum TaxID=29552 RepID=A0A449BD92_HAPAX|nr:hypothetical protein [Haploplasma axanthum]VEU80424.1 Uncharacterised protein [Haploplasma axanthum]
MKIKSRMIVLLHSIITSVFLYFFLGSLWIFSIVILSIIFLIVGGKNNV